jgi:hypothetical protein
MEAGLTSLLVASIAWDRKNKFKWYHLWVASVGKYLQL